MNTIVVDNKLSFKYHSSKCSRGANSKIYQLRKIRGSITTKCALSIYKTMILPLLEYGGVFLGSCTERERTKLQRLQNQALRTIYKKDNHTNLYSLHDKAKLLPLNLRREIALIKIIYNKVHNSHETQTKKMTTRAHDGPVIDVTKPNSTKYLKSIAYSGPVTWNQLKPDIRCIGDKNNFTRTIKSLYWESYKSMNTS